MIAIYYVIVLLLKFMSQTSGKFSCVSIALATATMFALLMTPLL